MKTLKAVNHSTQALLAEAEALCSLQHPNVVRVFGFCSQPELAVVMEYVAWGSLNRWHSTHQDNHSPVAVAARVDIAAGVAAGMAFLHSQGYIHLDLKPGNVLLAYDGVRFHAKVSDLGMAVRATRVVPARAPCESGGSTWSAASSVSDGSSSPGRREAEAEWGPVLCCARGTPPYIAPEQYQRAAVGGAGVPTHGGLTRVWVSQKCDVYSFGVLLAALFVGELRWDSGPLPTDPAARAPALRRLALEHAKPIVPPDTKVCVLGEVVPTSFAFIVPAAGVASASCGRVCMLVCRDHVCSVCLLGAEGVWCAWTGLFPCTARVAWGGGGDLSLHPPIPRRLRRWVHVLCLTDCTPVCVPSRPVPMCVSPQTLQPEWVSPLVRVCTATDPDVRPSFADLARLIDAYTRPGAASVSAGSRQAHSGTTSTAGSDSMLFGTANISLSASMEGSGEGSGQRV